MLTLLTYLLVATVIGWVATELMHDRSNLLLNIGLAVVGAFLAIYFLGPFLKVGTITEAITVPTKLVMLLGSVSLPRPNPASAGTPLRKSLQEGPRSLPCL